MHTIHQLQNWLLENTNANHFLFTTTGLRQLFPNLSEEAFKTLLSRATQQKILKRVCRGIYTYPKSIPPTGLILFHIAAMLRANTFNYISLETVLSAAGIISQVPINWVSIMSSGRRNLIHCGEFGTIEFIHTNQKISDIEDQLSYDSQCGMWRASIGQALRDMKLTHRNIDLIDWEIANELI